MANFEFVDYNGPGPRAATQQRSVRSHAARNPTARRDRVAQYQQQKHRREAADQERQKGLDKNLHADTTIVDRGPWSPPFIPKPGTAVGFLQRHPAPLDLLGAANSDPFDTFARKLTPMDHYLLDHFTNCMVWCGVEKYVACSLSERIYWCNQINRQWIQMAAQDAGVMASIMAAGCRHIDMVAGTDTHRNLALMYHAEVVTSLRDSLASEEEKPSDTTIVKTICLATEAATIDESALAMKHYTAALRMYQLQEGGSPKDKTPLTCAETSEFGYKNEYEVYKDRKALLSLYGSRSPLLRRRLVKWKGTQLDDGCFVYTHFMLSRCHLPSA